MRAHTPEPRIVRQYAVVGAALGGFALLERSVPFEDSADAAAVAEAQAREFDARAAEQHASELAEEYPHLAEVVAGHVAQVGHDFGEAFQDGLELILDALEARRVSTASR